MIDATLPLLEHVTRDAPFAFRFLTYDGGAQHYAKTGEALPAATLEGARAADAILFGAMGWPAIRYPDGTEIAPQLDLRVELELYAGRAAGARDSGNTCRRLPIRAPGTSTSWSCANRRRDSSRRADAAK